MSAGEPATIGDYLRFYCGLYDELPALRFRRRGRKRAISYGQLAALGERLAAGLRTRGLRPGQRVLIIGQSSAEWLLAYTAIHFAGGVDVAFEEHAEIARVRDLLRRSGARFVFCERESLAHEVAADLPAGRAIHLSWTPARAGAPYDSLESLAADGDRESRLMKVWRAGRGRTPTDAASIVFKRGDLTRPAPRGVVLSHAAILENVGAFAAVFPVDPDDSLLLSLPLWHSSGRLAFLFCVNAGYPLTISNPTDFAQDLAAFHPTLAFAGPPTFEALFRQIREGLPGESMLLVLARRVHLALCRVYNRWRDLLPEIVDERQGNVPAVAFVFCVLGLLWPVKVAGDILLRLALRRRLGGRLRAVLSGGASLRVALEDLFRMLKIPVLQGYWLTEAAHILACRTLEFTGQERQLTAGTVGPVLPGFELKILDHRGEDVSNMPNAEGHIVVRGPSLMLGYFREPELTRDVIDRQGWLFTGDRGRLLPSGELVLLGRQGRPAGD